MSISMQSPAQIFKFAKIDCASGDTTIVAAVSGSKIRVSGITFSCAAAVGVSFKSNSTLLLGPMAFDTNGGMDSYRGTSGIFCETLPGDALVMNASTTSHVYGSLMYKEV
jgi:hypothetical protein